MSERTCPNHQTPLKRRAADYQTPEQAWCGTWFDCEKPGCFSSVLEPSAELRTELLRQRAAAAQMPLPFPVKTAKRKAVSHD